MRKPEKLLLNLYSCLWLVTCLLFAGITGRAQIQVQSSSPAAQLGSSNGDSLLSSLAGLNAHRFFIRKGDTIIFINRNNCKGNYSTRYVFDNTVPVTAETERHPASPPEVIRKPFLRIQGNVQYDFLYRSYIDTPFSQHDFQQHTVQTFLNVTVKDKYPLKVNLSNRISNSPFFKNFMDVNMRFDRNAFERTAKQQVLDKINKQYWQKPDLTKAEAALKNAIDKYNRLKAALNSPDVLQKIVEERERQYYKRINDARKQAGDSLLQGADVNALDKKRLYKMAADLPTSNKMPVTIDSSYTKYIEQKKKDLDSLEQKIQVLQGKRDSIKNKINNDLATVRRKVYKAGHPGDLKQIESENGIEQEKKDGLENFLAHVKSIGIGRSVVNYSELTAWNVALTGLNIEYNNGIYAAAAAGKIDYGFRDFLGKNTRQKGQSFFMGRVGWGDVDHKAIILSAFTGRKYSYGSIVGDTVTDHINVTGYSIEGILKKDENTGVSVEMAKTTVPLTGSVSNSQGMKPMFQFSDNSNLGLSIKAQTLLTNTNTRVNGFYRKTGAQFQSFSLFTVNTNQTAWLLSVNQPFWNNKLDVTASVRRNDFTNPFSEKTFKTSTVFTSLQTTLRIPHWPVLTAGYYPGTQLYIVDKERIRENAYYILNASVVHNYTAGGIHMLSSLLYNKYSGKGTDSGFVAYKGISYMASHSFIFQRLQLQGVYVYTDQEQMQYYTLDAGADYSLSKFIRVGGGVKYNKITSGSSYMGSNAHLALEVKKLGGLQLQYEKSYLPTIWQTLYPIETGRVSWFKYF